MSGRFAAEVAGQAALYGGAPPPRVASQRPRAELLADVARGAVSLAAQVEAWVEEPTPGDVAGAVATVEGLRRLLGALSGGPRDG